MISYKQVVLACSRRSIGKKGHGLIGHELKLLSKCLHDFLEKGGKNT